MVEEVGPGVTLVAPGDHVILSAVPQCGRYRYCTIGRPALCLARGGASNTMLDGTTRLHKGELDIYHFASFSSFAEAAVVPEIGCVKIRGDAPLDKVSLIGCGVMTGVGAVFNAAKVHPGASVVVIGCGGVGLNAIQGAVRAGAGMIIAVDLLENKLTLARQFGATHALNGGEGDVVERVKELTGGFGVEYAFEVISTIRTIRQAYDCLAPGGTCVVVGVAPPASEVPIPTLGFIQERTITGTIYGSARIRVDMPMLVDLYMDGRLKLDELISQTLPLDGINQAFDDLRAGTIARTVLKY